MSYLVELVIKFPIDWHSNPETLILTDFRKNRRCYPLRKMWILVKKLIFRNVMGIGSLGCKLLKTVGLLAVRLDLTKLRLNNCKK